jgi:hypothetical protein
MGALKKWRRVGVLTKQANAGVFVWPRGWEETHKEGQEIGFEEFVRVRTIRVFGG